MRLFSEHSTHNETMKVKALKKIHLLILVASPFSDLLKFMFYTGPAWYFE